MTEENIKKTCRKQAWSVLAVTLVGLALLRLASPDHGYLDDARDYQPPALSDLNVTEGSLHLTKRYKGMGGDIIVTQADGSEAVFACVWPGVKRSVGCENVLRITEGDEKTLKPVLFGKPRPQGVVWWEPRIEGMPGRIYQIQVGDTVHLEYEKTARLYAEKKIIQDDPEGAHHRNWMIACMLMLPIVGLVFAFYYWFLPRLAQKRAKPADGD